MTLPERDGYDEFTAHLRAEGVRFEDFELTDPEPVEGAALPDKKTVDRLREALTRELRASEAARSPHMEQVADAWAAHDMTPYAADQLLMPEMEGVRTPLTRSRVDQAHGSLYGALAIRPFFKSDVPEGQDNTVGLWAEAALDEELERAEFENALDVALRGSLVGTAGFLKATVVSDEDEPNRYRLDVEAVDIRDIYLSPHEVRNLEQCNLIAHRYNTETWGWAHDNALNGVFDRKAVDAIRSSSAVPDWTDGGGTERAALGLDTGRGGETDESRQLDLLEAWIRFRPTEDSPREWWRVFAEYGTKTILRAERWHDEQPFTALRHQRGQTTMYAPSFANVLRDMQWASDMLMSASIEADRMGISPTWKVQITSVAYEYLKKRQTERGGAVRPLPGDVIPTRGGENELVPMYHQPTPPQIDARMNRIEQLANVATIPVVPMQTYRSATEHRYAQANVSGKEQQMLKTLRGDLSKFGEQVKRLYWRYLSKPESDSTGWVFNGSRSYLVTRQQWGTLRLTPRGMTTAADQMLTLQASQEALMLVTQILPQKPVMEQAGIWANVWEALRARLDALGIQDWEKYIGPNPVQDPNIRELDPVVEQRKQQAAMMLMQANLGMGGGGNMMGGGMGGPSVPGAQGDQLRGDGAPTVLPGGNPGIGGLN